MEVRLGKTLPQRGHWRKSVFRRCSRDPSGRFGIRERRGRGPGTSPPETCSGKTGWGLVRHPAPRPPSADCFEGVGPRVGSDKYGPAHAEHFCATPPLWKCGSAGNRTPNCDWRSARMRGVCGTDPYLFGFEGHRMIKVWRGGVNFVWNSYRVCPLCAEEPAPGQEARGGVNFVWNSTASLSRSPSASGSDPETPRGKTAAYSSLCRGP